MRQLTNLLERTVPVETYKLTIGAGGNNITY